MNSTYWPGSRVTAFRPDASAGRVYALRPGPMTVPFVAAFSASCSANPGSAPRPATSAGSSAARVTTGPADFVPEVPACAVPPSPSPIPAAAATTATVLRQVSLLLLLPAIPSSFLS